MGFWDRLFTALFEVHPLHSMTVHFPIALTAVALLFVVLALIRRGAVLEKAAFYNLALAAVSTVVTGITGMRDNASRYDGAAPNASVKLFLAITLLILTTGTVFWWWRKRDVLWNGSTMVLVVAAFAASFGLAAALGFLGGVILYGF